MTTENTIIALTPGDILEERDESAGTFTFKSALNNRLDKICSQACPKLSRSRLQVLIEEGQVTVNGAVVRQPSAKVTEGADIIINIPPPRAAAPLAQNIPLDIIYEDDDLIVINKPAGLVVHPAPGNYDSTLVNALLAHCEDSLSGIGGVKRPGIVHRLDKDTSGLLLVAKHDMAHQALSAQLADRSLSRVYKAIVWGVMVPPLGTISAPVGRSHVNRTRMAVTKTGKPATTYYKMIEAFGGRASLVSCKLESGRTHQIRVHLTHIGHAIIGDPAYGHKRQPPVPFTRQALHAAEISFIHPRDGQPYHFEAPLPDDMLGLINALRIQDGN